MPFAVPFRLLRFSVPCSSFVVSSSPRPPRPQPLASPGANPKSNLLSVVANVFLLVLIGYSSPAQAQNYDLYANNLKWVLGDVKQGFIQNKLTTQEEINNILAGFKTLKVNGIRVPIFPDGLTPDPSMFDYFMGRAKDEGFDIFASPANGRGGQRIVVGILGGEWEDLPPVKNDPAATSKLVDRIKAFSNEYPYIKWISPFNEDGRPTETWTKAQMNTIFSSLHEQLNGVELIGACSHRLDAGIKILENTDVKQYITISTTHNILYDNWLWDDFIKASGNLPVWDSETNHSVDNPYGKETRLVTAVNNGVDGVVLYNSWSDINRTNGALGGNLIEMQGIFLKALATDKWYGGAGSASWGDAANWDPAAPMPAFDNTTNLYFRMPNPDSKRLQYMFLGANRTVNSLVFGSNVDTAANLKLANSYEAGAAGRTLTFDGTTPGIQVNAACTQVVTIGSTAVGNVLLKANLTIDHAGSADLVIGRPIDQSGGPRSITKIGGGKLVLSAANTYTGDTNVIAGTLALTGTGSIANSPTIDVATLAIFDVSTVTGGGYTLGASQTLQGNGTVIGPMTAAGTVAPGSSTGTLTLGGALTLAGNALFEIDGMNPGDYDRVIVGTALTYGGTLTIKTASMMGPFDLDLFDFTSKTGTFTSISDQSGNYAPGQLSMAYDTGVLTGIPEPATMALLAFGGLGLILGRKRR